MTQTGPIPTCGLEELPEALFRPDVKLPSSYSGLGPVEHGMRPCPESPGCPPGEKPLLEFLRPERQCFSFDLT